MDISILLSIIRTLLAAINCTELKEVWWRWNSESSIEELGNVVLTINNLLQDAEAKYLYDKLSLETQRCMRELSFALCQADDLICEFVALAQQKHLLQEEEFIKEVLFFFSRKDPLGVACNMCEGVKNIRNKLDGTDTRHIRHIRDETCSYTSNKIIGREDDVEEIVGRLVDSDSSVLTIVGFGGIGKTAVAQAVFNHDKIKSEFSLRLWICVSDYDRSNLDVKAILSQILESAGGNSNGCSMGVVVNRVREVLLGKRFLIVVDDLWATRRDEWQKLLGHLVGGDVGSRIVVTTRSEETTNIMGKSSVKYKLKGLSDIDSWNLFKLVAFDTIEYENPNDSYVDKFKTGKVIVKTCVNVPLAIKGVFCMDKIKASG